VLTSLPAGGIFLLPPSKFDKPEPSLLTTPAPRAGRGASAGPEPHRNAPPADEDGPGETPALTPAVPPFPGEFGAGAAAGCWLTAPPAAFPLLLIFVAGPAPGAGAGAAPLPSKFEGGYSKFDVKSAVSTFILERCR
jgi:hypothetical protein